jgi:hypothetical protein
VIAEPLFTGAVQVTVADLLPGTAFGAAGWAGAAAIILNTCWTVSNVSDTVLETLLIIAADAFDVAITPVVIANVTSVSKRISFCTISLSKVILYSAYP